MIPLRDIAATVRPARILRDGIKRGGVAIGFCSAPHRFAQGIDPGIVFCPVQPCATGGGRPRVCSRRILAVAQAASSMPPHR